MFELGLTEINPWTEAAVHVPPIEVIVYGYVVWVFKDNVWEIVPEISINVPPLLIIVLAKETAGWFPAISLSEVATV